MAETQTWKTQALRLELSGHVRGGRALSAEGSVDGNSDHDSG
jgi:hypothetical protein